MLKICVIGDFREENPNVFAIIPFRPRGIPRVGYKALPPKSAFMMLHLWKWLPVFSPLPKGDHRDADAFEMI